MPHDTPKPPGYTRFVCISDTHSRTDAIQMPYGDVFIHAGDFTELGLPSEVKKFNDWLGKHESCCSASRAGQGPIFCNWVPVSHSINKTGVNDRLNLLTPGAMIKDLRKTFYRDGLFKFSESQGYNRLSFINMFSLFKEVLHI